MQNEQARAVTTKLAIGALAALGTSTAFSTGAVAGTALNDHVMVFSVAQVPMRLVLSPAHSHVNTHVR
ncbi:MAG TPA: hypothetical protein VM580_18460 [Labilithrix sp.]|nr:hypothetical protein [Labilithrix sp.]